MLLLWFSLLSESMESFRRVCLLVLVWISRFLMVSLEMSFSWKGGFLDGGLLVFHLKNKKDLYLL